MGEAVHAGGRAYGGLERALLKPIQKGMQMSPIKPSVASNLTFQAGRAESVSDEDERARRLAQALTGR